MADAVKSANQQLEEASQKHEANIVVDLGMDRLLRWIGVYFVLALAVVAKFSEAIGSNLSCYPANRSESVSGEFVSFSTAFCWENSNNSQKDNQCQGIKNSTSVSLLNNPSFPKQFIQWFPYILLLQSLIFIIPWAFWHFRVGGRLMGHLRFMQLLLSTIFEDLQDLEVGYYDDEPYDEDSLHFDGRRKEENDGSIETKNKGSPKKDIEMQALNSVSSAISNDQTNEKLLKVVTTDGSKSSITNSQPPTSVKEPIRKLNFFDRLLLGNMRDRHLFSMMCYENFASLHHLPYILSVFQLCEQTEDGQTPEPKKKFYPVTEGILYKWCHKKNFENVFLIKLYLWKHIITGIVAMVIFGLMTWFLVSNAYDVISSDTFACQLPYDDVCMLCTIRRTRDMFAMFCCDYVIMFLMFILSLGNWLVVRCSSNKASSRFFNHLMKTSNVALPAAALAREMKEKND